MEEKESTSDEGKTNLTSAALYACLDVSKEDEKHHPEAAACLKKIISTLGPNGVTASVKAKIDDQLAQHRSQHAELRQGPMLVSAIKQVLRDQEINGYDRLPEELVEEMTHKIYLTEMKVSLGDNMHNVLCLENIFSNIKPVELTPEHKQTLIELVNEKFAQIPLDFDELKADIDHSKQEYADTLALLQKKKMDCQRLEKENEELLMKLSVVAKDELKKQECELKKFKLEGEISILETRMHQYKVMKELYSGEKAEALKILVSRNEESIEAEKVKINETQEKLQLFSTLPQEELQSIVKEYVNVRKEIENAEWSLEKLQKEHE